MLWPSSGKCPYYRYQVVTKPVREIAEMTEMLDVVPNYFHDIPENVLHDHWQDVQPGSVESELLQSIYNNDIHASGLQIEFNWYN